MVKKSVNSTKRWQFSWNKSLKFSCGSGHQKGCSCCYCQVAEGRLPEIRGNGVNTTWAWMWLSTCNPGDELSSWWGFEVCMFCVLLRLIQLGAVVCIHLVFPVDGITYKQMQICSVLKFNISMYQSHWKKSDLYHKFYNRTDCTVFVDCSVIKFLFQLNF